MAMVWYGMAMVWYGMVWLWYGMEKDMVWLERELEDEAIHNLRISLGSTCTLRVFHLCRISLST